MMTEKAILLIDLIITIIIHLQYWLFNIIVVPVLSKIIPLLLADKKNMIMAVRTADIFTCRGRRMLPCLSELVYGL
jgi:hypothetical protein